MHDARLEAEAKLPYTTPRFSVWGTVADLTQGMGNTRTTDDFTCTAGKSGQTFNGSTGHCSGETL